MLETFRSYPEKYSIDSDRLIFFLDELAHEIELGNGLRRDQLDHPCEEHYSPAKLMCFYPGGKSAKSYWDSQSFDEDLLRGSTLRVACDRYTSPYSTIGVFVSHIDVGLDLDSVNMIINPNTELRFNPDPLYRVAEKYEIKK
ncbi:hypothetical protein HN587_01125 [Candidatus Woesearchaeota archaeon]|jgi:hypothetical protein|nr:hypothetical protein [Candidatus Woesearchaeota archaeon]